MKAETLPAIEIGYGDDLVIFHQKMIFVAEMDAIDDRLNAIGPKDKDRYQKQFEIAREALGTFASKPPEKVVNVEGEIKHVPLVEGAQTATEAIDKVFAERTAENERVIRGAFKVYQTSLNPNFRLLQLSVS